MKERIIIKNGRCMTMDERQTADWIVIEGERILAVGDGDDWHQFALEDSRIIDGQQCTVLPGFIDSHFHMVITGLAENFVNLEGARNFRSIGRSIKAARAKKKGELIVAKFLDATRLEEKRLPDRTVLDKYCNDAPVAVYSADYHVLILNTYGILYFKVPFTLDGVDLDEKGMPTGIFTNQAGSRLDTLIFNSFSDEDIDEAVSGTMSKLLACGITTIAAMEGGNMNFVFGEDKQCEFIYQHGKKYPIDMELFYQTTNVDYVMKKGLTRLGGNLYLDGTMGARTAALSFDYADAPGCRGLFCIDENYLKDVVCRCYEKNLQVALDAIGDEAIELALDAFELAVLKFGPKDVRNRIEHAELITEEQMKRAADLGIILSMTPAYEGIWGDKGGMYEQRLGGHYGQSNQFRQIFDSGITVCGGSDSDITDPNPMVGIHYAVNHPVCCHRVSLEEALKMYTIHGAYGLFRETEIGSLTPGKVADVIILSQDLSKLAPEKLKEVRVAVTIKEGQILIEG